MTDSKKPPTCEDCGKPLNRDHITEDYVFWECAHNDCHSGEMEHFSELDDEGWEWVRAYYQKESKQEK